MCSFFLLLILKDQLTIFGVGYGILGIQIAKSPIVDRGTGTINCKLEHSANGPVARKSPPRTQHKTRRHHQKRVSFV